MGRDIKNLKLFKHEFYQLSVFRKILSNQLFIYMMTYQIDAFSSHFWNM